ncbi:hypothetical protein Hanom_Chr08g00707121 [Helianthus anomalus]
MALNRFAEIKGKERHNSASKSSKHTTIVFTKCWFGLRRQRVSLYEYIFVFLFF